MAKWTPRWRDEIMAAEMKLVRREFLKQRLKLVEENPAYASDDWITLNRKLIVLELRRLKIKGFAVAESELQASR